MTENDKNKKIKFKFITLYTHEQNDIAEKMNQILIIIMRALIFELKILKNFWAFAAEAVCYIRNRLVMMKSVNEFSKEMKKKMKKISYKLWTDKKLQIMHMKIWECECWIHISLKQDADKLNLWSVEDVFIDYTENLSQYLIWMPERKKVIKTMNSIFIEDQQKMPVPRILKSAELERAQWERAQQIEILSLDSSHAVENVTENSSDENEFLNLIDRVAIQTCEKNNDKNDRQKLKTTTRSDQTVRLTEKMQQSKVQEAKQKRKKKTAVQEVVNMILEHAIIVKKVDQQDKIH